MDGSSKWTSREQGSWTSGLYADASSQAGSSSAAAATYCPVQQSDDQQVSAQSNTANALGCHLSPHTANGMQQGTQLVSEQALMPADMIGSTGTLQLVFHKGLYHDVITQSTGGIQSADLVFGANAGALVILTDMVVQVCWCGCCTTCVICILPQQCRAVLHICGTTLQPNITASFQCFYLISLASRLVFLCAMLERLCNLMPSLVLLSDYDPSHFALISFACRPCCISILGANSAAAES